MERNQSCRHYAAQRPSRSKNLTISFKHFQKNLCVEFNYLWSSSAFYIHHVIFETFSFKRLSPIRSVFYSEMRGKSESIKPFTGASLAPNQTSRKRVKCKIPSFPKFVQLICYFLCINYGGTQNSTSSNGSQIIVIFGWLGRG